MMVLCAPESTKALIGCLGGRWRGKVEKQGEGGKGGEAGQEAASL